MRCTTAQLTTSASVASTCEVYSLSASARRRDSSASRSGDPNVKDETLDDPSVAGPNPLTSEWMAAHAEEVGPDDGMRTLSTSLGSGG